VQRLDGEVLAVELAGGNDLGQDERGDTAGDFRQVGTQPGVVDRDADMHGEPKRAARLSDVAGDGCQRCQGVAEHAAVDVAAVAETVQVAHQLAGLQMR